MPIRPPRRLTPRQMHFLLRYAECVPPTRAAREARIAPNTARRLLQTPQARAWLNCYFDRLVEERVRLAAAEPFRAVLEGSLRDLD